MGLPRSNLVKSTAPLAFGAFAAPVAPVGIGETTLRDCVPLSSEAAAIAVARGSYPSAISTDELLERAAMGPARMTWESIVLPHDPILDAKSKPHVTERRERFTRMVKIGLGACLAVCALAVGVSALSSDSSSSASASAPATLGKTVASKSVVPVEALDGTKHAKAVRRGTPAFAAASVRPKRR